MHTWLTEISRRICSLSLGYLLQQFPLLGNTWMWNHNPEVGVTSSVDILEHLPDCSWKFVLVTCGHSQLWSVSQKICLETWLDILSLLGMTSKDIMKLSPILCVQLSSFRSCHMTLECLELSFTCFRMKSHDCYLCTGPIVLHRSTYDHREMGGKWATSVCVYEDKEFYRSATLQIR